LAEGAKGAIVNDYQKQAADFLTQNNLKFQTVRLACAVNPLWNDRTLRDKYRCTISRRGRRVSFIFWQSINGTQHGESVTAYDLLACLTKSDPGSFDNFCSDFGYTERGKAVKIYTAVCAEWKKIRGFFTDGELEALQEIS
jgi:hypothetical protein